MESSLYTLYTLIPASEVQKPVKNTGFRIAGNLGTISAEFFRRKTSQIHQ